MALISLFSEPIFDAELTPLGLGFASEDAFHFQHGHERQRKRHTERHTRERDTLATPRDQSWDLSEPAAPMDIVETPSGYELHADAPGLGPRDVKVELHNGVLQISGSRKSQHESKDPRGRLLRRERTAYSFSRAFSLPENANPDGITASMDKGVLVVTVPKRPHATAGPPAPKRIAVAAARAAKL